MPTISFKDDIKPIFSNYVACMKNVVVTDEEGTENLDLSNYNTVKRFHHIIQVAIHGHENDSTAPHRMPPGDPLPEESIRLFDRWVDEGMPA